MESRDKMTINFEHMKPWEAAYTDLRLAEENATKDSKAENILAMKSMRCGFEKMVFALAARERITDGMILQIKKKLNKDPKVDLYGGVLALSAYKVIDPKSQNNYNTIRILGNYATHDYRDPYLSASPQRVKKEMEQMYRLLYEETYMFANEYMKREPVLGIKNSNEKKALAQNPTQKEKKKGSCLGTIVRWIVGIAILGGMFAFLSFYM